MSHTTNMIDGCLHLKSILCSIVNGVNSQRQFLIGNVILCETFHGTIEANYDLVRATESWLISTLRGT